MQEITCFLSQPQDPLANLKWQLHARAAWITPDLNSEAIVHDLLHQYSVEACLLDQVSGEISSRTCYFEKSWCWFSAMKITIYIKYLGCFFSLWFQRYYMFMSLKGGNIQETNTRIIEFLLFLKLVCSLCNIAQIFSHVIKCSSKVWVHSLMGQSNFNNPYFWTLQLVPNLLLKLHFEEHAYT